MVPMFNSNRFEFKPIEFHTVQTKLQKIQVYKSESLDKVSSRLVRDSAKALAKL